MKTTILGKRKKNHAASSTPPKGLSGASGFGPSGSELRNEEGGEHDGLQWLDKPAEDLAGVERRVFIVANGVDIQSPILRDVLSDKPQDHMKKHSSTATEESLTSLQDNSATSTPKDSEWDMW
jgi:hypothetical protein